MNSLFKRSDTLNITLLYPTINTFPSAITIFNTLWPETTSHVTGVGQVDLLLIATRGNAQYREP